MPELRICPLSGERTIIAPERAGRPGGELEPPAAAADPPPDDDPFAPGCEERTPAELAAVRTEGGRSDGPGWSVRVVPNLYPALEPGAEAPPPVANPDLLGARAARGSHEVIVNSARAVGALARLEREELIAAMAMWRERMRAHAGAACVHLSVNEGTAAGASIAHSHAQLFALDFVPATIARERERARAYALRTMGAELLADLLGEEVRAGVRIVAIDDEAVVLAPFASRVPYQLMLVPRRPRPRFEDDGPDGAALLHDALRRLERHFGSSPALNLWVRTAPRGAEHFCWRIDVAPRLAPLGALELGAGLHLNVVAPEQAAERLRAA